MEEKDAPDCWPTAEMQAQSVAQAKALRTQAQKGGLRFEAYLPPRLADWLLERIEQGLFLDPSEAVFVMLGEQQELEPHRDLRQELVERRLQMALNDPHPGIPAEEVFEKLRQKFARPHPEPVTWIKPEKKAA
jgi:antitoxin ParD1/3/4